MPDDKQFNFARSACAQFVVEQDGAVLLPFNRNESWVTVCEGVWNERPQTRRKRGFVRCSRDLVKTKLIDNSSGRRDHWTLSTRELELATLVRKAAT
jgi:hypothetical protein